MKLAIMPILRPLLEAPLDWQRIDKQIVGGFHTQELRLAAPFIKTRGEKHREFVEAAYPYKHIAAVNHMQETAWRVNKQVADLVDHATRQGWEGFGIPRADKLPLARGLVCEKNIPRIHQLVA